MWLNIYTFIIPLPKEFIGLISGRHLEVQPTQFEGERIGMARLKMTDDFKDWRNYDYNQYGRTYIHMYIDISVRLARFVMA